jgi:hypothetical protein
MPTETQETQKPEGLPLLYLLMEDLCEEVQKLQPCVVVTSLTGKEAYLPVDDIECTKAAYREIAKAKPCSSTCRCAEQATSLLAQLEGNPEQVYVIKVRNQHLRFPLNVLETLKTDVQAYKAWVSQVPKETAV